MRKFFTFILLLIIGFIAIFQIFLMKNKSLFEEVCAYQYSFLPSQATSTGSTMIDKKYLGTCLIKQTFKKISQNKLYCKKIQRPTCAINENDIYLCENMIKQDKWTGTKEDCQLNWACPELVTDYQNLIKQCQN